MKLKALVAISLFAVVSIHADIIPITTFDQMDDEFNHCNESTLVIFDVDEVLITTEDHFIQPHVGDLFHRFCRDAFKKAHSDEEREELSNNLSAAFTGPKRHLVEKEIPSKIKQLQDRGVKVIALTASPVGKYGRVESAERWRIEHLNGLGINFAPSFPSIDRHQLEAIKHPQMAPPVFEAGILFSIGHEKGVVLRHFLEMWGLQPTKVVFIDDLMENLQSVEKELANSGIEFKGYLYKGAEPFFKELNLELLHYQLDHLKNNGEWLSDIEVAQRLFLHTYGN